MWSYQYKQKNRVCTDKHTYVQKYRGNLMPQPLSWQWNNDLVIEKFKYSTFGAIFWIRIREYFGHLCAYLQSHGNSKAALGICEVPTQKPIKFLHYNHPSYKGIKQKFDGLQFEPTY